MIYRVGALLLAVTAGVAVGAVVFKVVGEERIGGEIRVLASRFGFNTRPGDSGAIDLLERMAPGTSDRFKGAAIGTVLAATLAACAVTISVREITT